MVPFKGGLMMKDLNRRLFYHLDDLREDAGITINDFCEGVCDRRQYSRYKNGRHEISLKNISKFYRKLGFSEIEFYYSFYSSDLSEYPKLNKLYFYLTDLKLKEAKKLINELRDVELSGGRTIRYFNFLVLYFNLLDKRVTKAHSLELFKKLIDYDNCVRKRYFDFVDIISLRQIMIIEMKSKERKTLDFMYNLLTMGKFIYVTSESRNVMPSIYASVAKHFGILGELNKVMEISTMGIDYCIEINNMHLLYNLYYFKGLALYKTGLIDESYEFSCKALSVLYVMNDHKTFEFLKGLIDKDYGFDSIELFRNFEFDKNGTKTSQ